VIDSYTHYVLEYMERINKTSRDTVNDLVRDLPSFSSAAHNCFCSFFFAFYLHSFTLRRPQFAYYDRDKIRSDPGVRADLFTRVLDSVRLTDFFGGVAQVEVGSAREFAKQEWDEDLAVAEEESRPKASRPKASSPKASKQTSAREPRGAAPKEESWGGQWRAWGGVVLLAALVGWAGWK